VLDFSRIEGGGLELEDSPFALVDAVESSIHMCYDLAKDRKLELVYEFDRSCPSVIFGDSARLQQILLNLLANGTKFTLQGFIRVTVSARPACDGAGFHMLEERPGVGPCAWYEIQMGISDTGIGITDKMLSRLFKPFNQGDSSVARKYGGTGIPALILLERFIFIFVFVGLGLAISRRLAEAMKGKMWVESEAGKGSTFSFTIQACSPLDPSTIPLSPSLSSSVSLAAQANLHGLSQDEVAALRGLRMLVVCESEAAIGGWQYLCSSYEMQVVQVYNGLAAASAAVFSFCSLSPSLSTSLSLSLSPPLSPFPSPIPKSYRPCRL